MTPNSICDLLQNSNSYVTSLKKPQTFVTTLQIPIIVWPKRSLPLKIRPMYDVSVSIIFLEKYHIAYYEAELFFFKQKKKNLFSPFFSYSNSWVGYELSSSRIVLFISCLWMESIIIIKSATTQTIRITKHHLLKN